MGGRLGKRLMVIMPHPDDECFGCGATMARYAAEGVTVSLVTMTRGGGGLWQAHDAGDLRRLTDVREVELRRAADLLGVTFLELFDYPDGALERVEEVPEVRARFCSDIVRCIRAHRPQVVVTFGPEGGYGHPDHRMLHRMVVEATPQAGDPDHYPAQLRAVGISAFRPHKLYFQAASAGTVAELKLPAQPPVTTRIEVSAYVEHKRRAFACHRSQAQEWEPLDAFIAGDETHELFSLAGAPARLEETDLFAGL
ncbi:MAG TPA: PIG-L deacetylase family protein [Candidatus Limnocylindrales bacterium]|nr:PIG-L deacetylase family protein [Candidatus Limnocylindrales bacterium]